MASKTQKSERTFERVPVPDADAAPVTRGTQSGVSERLSPGDKGGILGRVVKKLSTVRRWATGRRGPSVSSHSEMLVEEDVADGRHLHRRHRTLSVARGISLRVSFATDVLRPLRNTCQRQPYLDAALHDDASTVHSIKLIPYRAGRSVHFQRACIRRSAAARVRYEPKGAKRRRERRQCIRS